MLLGAQAAIGEVAKGKLLLFWGQAAAAGIWLLLLESETVVYKTLILNRIVVKVVFHIKFF